MKKKIIFSLLFMIIAIITIFSTKSNANSEKTVKNGIYTITSSLNNNYSVDVEKASEKDCANIELWESNNQTNQQFKVIYENGYYTIQAVNSNKNLDIYGGYTKAGTNVQQFKSNGEDNQKWILKDVGNGNYNIISKSSNLYLDIYGGYVKNGANLQIWNPNGEKNQKFKFNLVKNLEVEESKQNIEDGKYYIHLASNKDLLLGVNGNSVLDGGNIQLSNRKNIESQQFNVFFKDGYYVIENVNSKKYMDVYGNFKEPGTNVQQFEGNNEDNQKWILKDLGNDTYNIISKSSNLNLDIYGGYEKNGANVQLWNSNGNNNQKFKFEKVKDEPEENIKPEKSIEDGVYKIKSALNQDYTVDITGGNTENETNVELWKYYATVNQKFYIKCLKDNYYSITNISSGKSLDVYAGKKENDTNLQIFDANENSDNQKWVIKKTEDGMFNIISKCNNLFINVNSKTANNGANLSLWEKDDSNSQKFIFESVEDGKKTIENGSYIISPNANSNLALDIYGGYIDNNTKVELWDNLEQLNQKFKIEYTGQGNYYITALNSNKVLQVKDSSMKEGTEIVQNALDYEVVSQKWVIKDAENGSYYIINEDCNLAIDIYGGYVQKGTKIQTWTKTNGSNQQFVFKKIENFSGMDENKYPGYADKIRKLVAAHPTWNFKILETGLSFREVVNGEYSVRARNLVPSSYTGEWIDGTQTYDTGSWYAASQKAIAYYMDPRNFLDETNIFQFQDVNSYLYDACTIQGIQKKVSGTFLNPYANDINAACINTNVNPYYVIARLIQEQGTKGGATWKMESEGAFYYNPFNIGATGNGRSSVIANALNYAKDSGWDSMEKAIEGGIYFLKLNWLDNYQNTLYTNKFDIDKRSGIGGPSALYAHQYMQNLLAAYSEALTLRSMYANTGKLDSNFTFIIPVYTDMDADISSKPSSYVESSVINVTTTGTNVNMRSSADINSSIVKTISNPGEILLSIERGINSNWQKIVTTDGTIGYIRGDLLKQVDDIKTCNYSARVKTNDGDGCYGRYAPTRELPAIQPAFSDGTHVIVIDDSTYKNISGYDWSRCILDSGMQVFFPSKFLARD